MMSIFIFALLFGHAIAFSIQSEMSPLKLYGSQGSRSPLVSWYLHELELPFDVVGRDNSNPHPFGQIPCLVDNNVGTSVFESGAILIYLATQYGTFQNEKERGDTLSWSVWANASLDPVLFKENERGQVIGTGAGQENRRLRGLDTHLEGKNYLATSDRFTAADVAVGAYLLYVPQFFGPKASFKMYPNIASYMKRCASRDAYRKAYPTETDGILSIVSGYC
mmetsp:Transcript_10942/g.15754  ORF Transcript_10942/g.15754 Transcript_10942/m.15754 type:complete len:222 (-) Transcript_10942:166-831(-)|eukprot:CAMPEP_0172428862 /NCGR_PEP_ID=MMETSP1064-20121228/48046_1 /TAXON_ID=202472 /ORGANISM="Aulacoseira subarctica , Strain CCAP 1002/5" /LENGTH=221 /DNA_ID=CAMNT_0013173873 /DNA_START=59 /DNA_END=724 /DNA_ORIENTATION=+